MTRQAKLRPWVKVGLIPLATIAVVVAGVVLSERPRALWKGHALAEQGAAEHRADRPDEAWDLFQKALEIAEAQEDPYLRIEALLGLAEVAYVDYGSFDDALDMLDESLVLARRRQPREDRDLTLEAKTLRSLGDYYWFYRRQRHRVVEEFYGPALELYHQLEDRSGLAAMHSRIALTRLAEDDYEAVSEHLSKSRELFEAVNNTVGLSDVHRFFGVLYGQLERHDLARQHYGRSLEFCRKADYQAGCRLVQAQMASHHLRLGDFERAVEMLDRWIEEGAGDAYSVRNHLVTRGGALLHLGRLDEARASYERALAIDLEESTTGDPEFRAPIWTMLAHVHMQASDLQRAEAALAEAEAIPLSDKGWGSMVLHTLARADWAAMGGHPREALEYLLEASEIEHHTFGSASSLFYQTQYRQVFERLLTFLFQDVVSQDTAEELTFRFLEQMRYRAFRSVMVRLGDRGATDRSASSGESEVVQRIESLAQQLRQDREPQVWDALQRAYADFEDVSLRGELATHHYRRVSAERPAELRQVQGQLGADQALVEYVVAGDRVFALMLTREGLSSAVMPATASALEAKVKLFRRLLFSTSEPVDERWRPLAMELHRLLVTPLEADRRLDSVGHLILVPMGFLHDLPFAALSDSEGTLLVEDYVLVRSPSATLWSRPSPVSRESSTEMVAFGLRQAKDSPLEPLPQAVPEARAVAALFDGSGHLGLEATEVSFKKAAPRAERLHLATHGIVEERLPLHSHLVLEAGGGEDGVLTVREILDLRLTAELVALSACGTGLSVTASGLADLEVDRLGFVEAFLHAGADNVLATLLPVSDASTAALMIDVHRRLVSTSPAEALAATRRQMVAEGAVPDGGEDLPDLSHPRYWAPFILVSGRQGKSVEESAGH